MIAGPVANGRNPVVLETEAGSAVRCVLAVIVQCQVEKDVDVGESARRL